MAQKLQSLKWKQELAWYWAIQRSWFARVNALCNLSRKESRKVAAHFRADFWVGVASLQWKLNLELRSSTNANTAAVAKITVERGWKVGKKSVFASFFGWPENRDFVEKMRFGASYSTSNKLLFIARHILTTGHQKFL